MATRPKGYLTKGKTNSADAMRKSNARKQLTTLKGIGGIVGNAVLNSPAGRVGKAGKVSSKVMLAVRREMRKKAAGVGQPAKVTTGQAKLVTNEISKAPVKRTRNVVSKDAGRGLSDREKKQVVLRDTVTRPKPNKPKSKIEIAMLEKEARDRRIRRALTVKVNPARPKPTPKRETPKVSIKPTPKRTVIEIRNTLKDKKVKTGDKMRMNAQEYFDTRLAQKSAIKDQRNSVRAATRESAQERTATANKKVARENRLERRRERRDIRRDVRAEKANPERYSSPKKELGNRIMSDRLVAIGEESIKKGEASRAVQRAKIAATPRVQKKVDATLDEAAKARAAAARRNRIDSRKITVRKKRGE